MQVQDNMPQIAVIFETILAHVNIGWSYCSKEDLTVAKDSACLTLGGCHEGKQGKGATKDDTDPRKTVFASLEENLRGMTTGSEAVKSTR